LNDSLVIEQIYDNVTHLFLALFIILFCDSIVGIGKNLMMTKDTYQTRRSSWKIIHDKLVNGAKEVLEIGKMIRGQCELITARYTGKDNQMWTVVNGNEY